MEIGSESNQFKVILCGRKHVGKTTLLHLMSQPIDYDDNSQDPLKSVKKGQDNISFEINHQGRTSKVCILLYTIIICESYLRILLFYIILLLQVEVWDTSSFEKHGGSLSLPKVYFRHVHAAILIYLSGDQDSKLELREWTKTVLENSPNCMLHIWGNNRQCEFGNSSETRDIISVHVANYGISQDNCITYTERDIHEVHFQLERLVKQLQSNTTTTTTETAIKLHNEEETGLKKRVTARVGGCPVSCAK